MKYVIMESRRSDCDDYTRYYSVIDVSNNKEELEEKCKLYNEAARLEDSYEEEAFNFYESNKRNCGVEIPEKFESYIYETDDQEFNLEDEEIWFLNWNYGRERCHYNVQEVKVCRYA